MHIFKILTPVLVIFSAILVYTHVPTRNCQLFSIQAQSFIEGRLDIPKSVDAVFKNGKYYWPQGPFPSIILIPFHLIFGPQFNQTIMQPLLIIILATLLYRLARIKNFQPKSSLSLAYAFLFGSQTVGIITEPCYSYFAHIITIILLTATIIEFESKKRPLIIGILLSAAIATRLSVGLIFIPVIYYYWHLKNPFKQKAITIMLFILPVILIAVALLWFNQIRFQNPFDNGYASNNVGDYLNGLRSGGVFSLQHVPSNFYYYFLAPVQPVISKSDNLVFPFLTYSPFGLSFLIVSPFFLYALKTLRYKQTLLRLYWFVIFITLIILLSYYSAGWAQFGPRFLSDIMPMLYLLLLNGLNPPKLSNYQKSFIFLSSLFNIYLILNGFFIFNM
ncbi:MAG: hypothetical protein Q7R82_02150 [Candidatus Daviesbacteria bacterium]|nr:hypothetical protein [Candidatus Daviesbacteria bacterium]